MAPAGEGWQLHRAYRAHNFFLVPGYGQPLSLQRLPRLPVDVLQRTPFFCLRASVAVEISGSTATLRPR
jgi:hypothetical protein